LEEDNVNIHLLLTDVIMPEMNGREFYEKLALKLPGLKCIYMSGYSRNVIGEHGLLGKGVNFIQKPFTMKDLSKMIRQVLS
jgi:YesN/AraC family two-component response regulator